LTNLRKALVAAAYRMITPVVLMILTFEVFLPLPARAQDLQNDDLVVGAGIGAPFGPGIIWRLRGGALDDFCDSTTRSFGTPTQVMVDSQGQVVFVAPMQSSNLNFPHWGLFRCGALGAAPNLLAVFPGIGNVNPGDPVPFAGQTFDAVAGLHLARAVAGTINDQVNGGAPQVSNEDVYVLVVGQFDTTLGQRVAVKTVRYHTASGVWEEGPKPCVFGTDCPAVFGGLPHAINHGGVTYFATASSSTLRRVKDPISVNVSGSAGGINFSVQVSLFGGISQVSGLILDYVNLPHVPSGCPPDPPVSGDMPVVGAGFPVMSGYNLVYDEWTGLGLMLESNGVSSGSPYQANVSEDLLDKPGDLSQYFQNNAAGCEAEPTLKVKFIMPTFGPNGDNTLIGSLTSAPSGIVGTDPFGQTVDQLVPGSDHLLALANRTTFPALFTPVGVGAFPATASPSGVTIVIRLDSPINVVVAGPDGRRIGVDPVTGVAVNDFSDNGFDSGPGEPRFFAIRNATIGGYGVQVVGTGSGPYALHVYSLDPSQAVGQHIETTGAATPGSTSNADFTLGAKGAIAFVTPPGGSDTIPPFTMALLSPPPNGAGWNNGNVTVNLTSTDNEPNGSGVKQISYSAAGGQAIPSTTVSGATASVTISNEGVTTLSFFGTDNAANVESAKSVTIEVDKTPPSINCGAPDGLWHPRDVSIACTAGDSVSGLSNAADANFSLSTSVPAGTETTNAATGTRPVCDVAGNCATAGPIDGNMVDKKPPTISASAPTAGSTYLVNQTVNASYSCTDGGSGVATCSGTVASGSPIDTTSVGSKSFTVNSTDKVGNVASPQSINYSVGYGVCLLYDPTRSVQGGSTIPLKIQLCDANNADVSSSSIVVHGLSLAQASTNASEVLQGSGNANPDNDFRFDSTLGPTGGYIFNLSTKGLTTGSYLLTFTAGTDPSSHTLVFQVR